MSIRPNALPGLKFSLKLLTFASGAGLFSAGAAVTAEGGGSLVTLVAIGAGVALLATGASLIKPAAPPPNPYPFGPKFFP